MLFGRIAGHEIPTQPDRYRMTLEEQNRLDNIVAQCIGYIKGPAKMTVEQAVKDVKATHGPEMAEAVQKRLNFEVGVPEIEL